MARPTKWRRIAHIPSVAYFIPADKPLAGVAANVLKLEELEAVRLKDLEGLEQEECAERMAVSRPTFQRILISAREKIADSLVNGKTVTIEGGNFTLNICSAKCLDCGREWQESYENLEAQESGGVACPGCGSESVVCGQTCKNKFCRRSCCRHS